MVPVFHRNARDQNSVFLLVRQPSITERTSARRFFTRPTQLSRLQRSVHILEAVIWSHTIHSNYIYFQWKRRLIRPRTPAAALVACTTSRCCTSASVRVDILAGMKRSAVGKIWMKKKQETIDNVHLILFSSPFRFHHGCLGPIHLQCGPTCRRDGSSN